MTEDSGHEDGVTVSLETTSVIGNVNIGSGPEGEYNISIEKDITAGEDALTIRNNNSEINVDVQGSITSEGGTGIAVNNTGDLEWVEAGTFDSVEDLPAGRSGTEYELIPNPAEDEMQFILDHRSTINEDNEYYNDDILYEYKTDVYTDETIPLRKDDKPDQPAIDSWALPYGDASSISVSYGNDEYTADYEINGEEYKPETQKIYAAERKDYGGKDVTNVNVGEDVIVTGESKELTGISVRSDNKFNETNIIIGGSVKVTSLDANEEGDHTAAGIIVDTLEGDINIHVADDVVVKGGASNTGIVLNRHAHEEFAAGSAEKVNPGNLNGISLGDQIIDGKAVEVFEAEQTDGTALYYDGEGNVYDCVTVANEGTTKVVIGRDVISDGNGVELTAGGEEKTDLIIDGSVVTDGGTSIVLKDDDTVLGDKLTLTVWEMTADRDGDYVKRETFNETTGKKKLVADREAEKAIQYIIRIDPSQEGIIHTDGTRDYQGRNVANEGDIIVLKIDVPAGLMIDEVYGDHQAHSKLIQDSYGNYFMIVPRGGGVLFSVILKDYIEPEPEPQPLPLPQPDPEPQPVPVPEPKPEPEPQPEPNPEPNPEPQPEPEPEPAPEPEPEPKPEPKPEPQPEPAPAPEPEPAPAPAPEPNPEPEPQPEPQPMNNSINKPAEIAVHVVRPLLSATDITGSVQLNFFRGGTFTAQLLKGRNTYTGKITLYSDGTLYLIGPDGLEMPINEKGDFTLIIGSERFTFVFTAADLAVLRACLP